MAVMPAQNYGNCFKVSYVSTQTVCRLPVTVTSPKPGALTSGLVIALCHHSIGFSDRAATTAQRKNPSSEKEKEAAVK